MLLIAVAAVLVQSWRDITGRLKLAPSTRYALLWGGGLAALAIYVFYPRYHVGQAIGEINSPGIFGGITVGQSFVSPCNHLYQIDVKIRTNNPAISQKVTFHLREGNFDGPELYSTELDTKDVRRANYTGFAFPEISNSAGQPYTFFFDTAAMPSEANGLVVLIEPEIPVDTVKNGSALLNGQKMPGDLTFFAYCQGFFD